MLLTRGSGTVSGRIIISGGELPLGGQLIIWFERIDGQNISAHQVQDPDSRDFYRIDGVLPGCYRLWCEVTSVGPRPPAWEVRNPTDSREFEVEENQTLKIDLRLDLAIR